MRYHICRIRYIRLSTINPIILFFFNLFVPSLFGLNLRSVFCVQSHFFLRSDPFYVGSLNSFYVEKQFLKFRTILKKHYHLPRHKRTGIEIYVITKAKSYFSQKYENKIFQLEVEGDFISVTTI
jgi:hypothetical protein